jgi:hypothetical protein
MPPYCAFALVEALRVAAHTHTDQRRARSGADAAAPTTGAGQRRETAGPGSFRGWVASRVSRLARAPRA